MSVLIHGCFLSLESTLAIWQARIWLFSLHGDRGTGACSHILLPEASSLGEARAILDFLPVFLSFSGQLT